MTIVTKHTSGPWQLFDGRSSDRNGDQLITASDGKYRATFDSTPLAWVLETTPVFNQFTANARLIAAAPELLDALQEAVHALNTVPKFRVGDTNSYAIANLCDQAINKAIRGDSLKST